MRMLFIVLILLVSCGKKGSSSSKSGEEQNPRNCLASNTACMPTALWVINSNANNFPKNFQLFINGGERFDTCRRDPVSITSFNNRVTATIKLQGEVGVESVRLKIIDKGIDCREEKVFFESSYLRIYMEDHTDPEDFFVSQKVSAYLSN